LTEAITAKPLGERLLLSHWPQCNVLAEELAKIGGHEAKAGLLKALGAKRHHIRTAAIKALVTLGDHEAVQAFEDLLDDPSYETRMQAKEAIKALTGRDVMTKKGE
jgi:HEAT repeat protein